MVLTIAIPLRKYYHFEDFITMRHLENMAKVMLATGLIVAYGYFFEFFMSLYSGQKFDVFLVQQRLHGPYSHFYYALILCNILTPQLLWLRSMRTNVTVLFLMSIVVNIGMWLERFVIVVISLTRDFMPSAWGRYSADGVGLGHVHRHARAFHHADLPVRARASGDFHCGNARTGGAPGGARVMDPRSQIYGVMGEFESAKELIRAAAKTRDAGYKKMDAYAPYPVEGLSEALGLKRNPGAIPDAAGRSRRRFDGIWFSILGECDQLSHEYRRTAAEQLAGVYPGDFRIDDSGRFDFCGIRDAGAEQAAAPASSGFQCGALCASVYGPLFYLHRGHRSEIQRDGKRAVSAEPECAARDGSARR